MRSRTESDIGYPHAVASAQELAGLLRAAGLKVTAIRRALLALVTTPRRAMTAEEIVAGLREMQVSVDRVTVYRNMERLMAAGILVPALRPGKALRVGLCLRPRTSHHHHVVCDTCGRIEEAEGCVVNSHWPSVREAIRRATGFEPTGHRLQYSGICPECREQGVVPEVAEEDT